MLCLYSLHWTHNARGLCVTRECCSEVQHCGWCFPFQVSLDHPLRPKPGNVNRHLWRNRSSKLEMVLNPTSFSHTLWGNPNQKSSLKMKNLSKHSDNSLSYNSYFTSGKWKRICPTVKKLSFFCCYTLILLLYFSSLVENILDSVLPFQYQATTFYI